MRVRRAVPDDVQALIDFPGEQGLVGLSRDQVRTDFDTRRLRPEWSWVLEAEGRVVGRALWWGSGDGPSALDALDLLPEVARPAESAALLLRHGLADLVRLGDPVPPPYTIRLPPGWREDLPVERAVQWRLAACSDLGLTSSLERLQYAWTRSNPVPAASNRLGFRTGTDDEFLELFQHVALGSLDIETQRALETMDARGQAEDDLEFYLGCPGDRAWWRVAYDGTGTRVGFIVPSATPYHRNVGYLGVLPAHRGRGLVDHLLGEVTRIHAAAGAERITATTDLTNKPMAAAFERGGYAVTEVRMVLSAPR